MKFGYTIIYVEDVLKTVDFYQKALSLKLKYLHDSHKYAEMDTGATTISFASEALEQGGTIQFKPNKPTEVSNGFELVFVTDDVDAAYKKAVAFGAKPISAPAQKSWGQTVAYLTDINGVLVEICTPMSA